MENLYVPDKHIIINDNGFWNNDLGFVPTIVQATRFEEPPTSSPTNSRFVNLNDLVFVFGSNLAGAHLGGAANHAFHFYDATPFVPIGPQGRAYGIATLDAKFEQLPLPLIHQQVLVFDEYAKGHPEKIFWVTAIGTGIAGFAVEDIKPMFTARDNVYLPKEFK